MARGAQTWGSGTWESAVITGEFAAIRSAGFLAVGRVLGAAVYDVVGVRLTIGFSRSAETAGAPALAIMSLSDRQTGGVTFGPGGASEKRRV